MVDSPGASETKGPPPPTESGTERQKLALRVLNQYKDCLETFKDDVKADQELYTTERDGLVSNITSLLRDLNFKPSDIARINFKEKVEREEDQVRLSKGEDVGVLIEIDLKDGRQININTWGGLREIESGDYQDTSGAHLKTGGHAARTEAALSTTTSIAVNVSRNAILNSDSRIDLDRDWGKAILKTFTVEGKFIHSHLRTDLIMSDDTSRLVIRRFQKMIPKLYELRNAELASQPPIEK